jgi:asparagine synthase (glutamine-hydrolysing)
MCDAIAHRGPDSDGFFVADDIAMGMRRLSIIDVGGGRQPIFNEDGSVVVVFNGEIYNHRALRKQMEARGHTFRTHSDTEVLVHLYEEFGSEMVPMLHGMFAFSIWDSKKSSLLIARDRTGMKPLSYQERSGGLVYCSELRSLWAFEPGALSVAPFSVTQFLAFGYVPDPHSIFTGVKKLLPGHLLEWNANTGVKIRKFWSPPVPTDSPPDEATIVTTLREKLDAAVASHLESEVPLGAFLSGGLDSSTVVALMSRHAAGRVKTFSIGFSEDEYDESSAARSVAKHFETEHTELIVQPNVETLFDAVATMFDEPFGDTSAIPTFLVAQLARQTVTVALSGDGGDELFGGYTRYREVLGQGTSDPGFFGRLAGAMGQLMPHIAPGRNYLINKGRTRWGRYASTVVAPVRIDEGGVVLAAQPGGLTAIEDQLAAYVPSAMHEDFAAAMMQVDLDTYLPGDILTKVDRVTMAVSLEARVPLLDFDLVDYALHLPGTLRMTAGESKRLFRQAITGIVPDSVLTRPKQGFEMPLGRWFRGPLRHRIESLRSTSSELRPYVDTGAVARLVSEHSMGRRDHSGILWRLIVLQTWLQSMQRGHLGAPPVLPAHGLM